MCGVRTAVSTLRLTLTLLRCDGPSLAESREARESHDETLSSASQVKRGQHVRDDQEPYDNGFELWETHRPIQRLTDKQQPRRRVIRR